MCILLFYHNEKAEFKYVIDEDIDWLSHHLLNQSCLFYYGGTVELEIERKKLTLIDRLIQFVSRTTFSELVIRANERSAFDMYDALVPHINSNTSIKSLKVVASFHLTQAVYAYERLVSLIKSITIPITEWSVYGIQTVTSLTDIHGHLANNPITKYSMIKYDTFSRYESFYFDHLMEPLFVYLESCKTITELLILSPVPHEYIFRVLANNNNNLKKLFFPMNYPVLQQLNNNPAAATTMKPINYSVKNLRLESSYKQQLVDYPIMMNPTEIFKSITKLSVRFSKHTIQHFQAFLSFIPNDKTIRSLEIFSSFNLDLINLFASISTNSTIEHLQILGMIQKDENNYLNHWSIISHFLNKNRSLQKINIFTYSDRPPIYIELELKSYQTI
ncbi:hypothetical protein PPL_05773 [Heterostelium album PN500]|uniref:Uncharacterized protein n=1 Tax=Heterostelium pallidum (strain ATCC 26659 / Pp 5 / PN500) TaxID=670386 RepID=D3BB41_HETP5|nr:hypothetical protein PPL_05773 [Heterostelium album PN500]EFA81778.1 hypothetical protein PPL_05773 [Heterostelium album PN500]|eukprot:XP_020433895.1 hypothetical protein PPL_05773 [Heterostelium album PN500]